ncbi:MAG: sulfatase-like hydrolase/transferase, partial [Puniceicoccales bacterium]
MPIRNVIYIHAHDMGRYISPYGYAIPTPHLEAFSRQATLFRQAYCCGPTCSPSRAGLLTGVTPHESGMLGLAHRGFSFTHPEYHLGHYLKEQGFETALCGIQHEFHDHMEQMPYEHVRTESAGRDYEGMDRTWMRAAKDFLGQSHERPFFLSYGVFYPHRPFARGDDAFSDADGLQPPAPLPDVEEVRSDMADYHRTVNLADACMGEVFEAIRSHGHDK